jgi:hypothetical protein
LHVTGSAVSNPGKEDVVDVEEFGVWFLFENLREILNVQRG